MHNVPALLGSLCPQSVLLHWVKFVDCLLALKILQVRQCTIETKMSIITLRFLRYLDLLYESMRYNFFMTVYI